MSDFEFNLSFEKEEVANKFNQAILLITEANAVDGGHHKVWYLDQVFRVLLGEKQYAEFVEWYETPIEEDWTPEWDTGIAP